MEDISPMNLVLRCYGYKKKDDPWIGICIDLNIAVQADSVEELKKKMNDAIGSYIDLVLDTNDNDSIPSLLLRRAPLKDQLFYHAIKCFVFIKKIQDSFTFNGHIPVRLAHNC